MISIVLLPSFEKEFENLDKSHRVRIVKIIEEIKENGLNALKILRVRGKYLLTEAKSKNPPYRLYVFVDQEKEIFYIAKWEHKKLQKKIIEEFAKILEESLQKGLENVLFRKFI